MKKVKQITAVIIALAVMATSLTGCGNKNNSDSGSESSEATATKAPAASDAQEETTVAVDPLGKLPELTTITRAAFIDPNVTYPDGQSLGDNAYTRMLESQFNIKIENSFEAGSEDYSQKIDLAIASGEMPDYMTGLSYTQYKAAVRAGLAMDISEVWNEYASAKSKEVYDSRKELFDSLVTEDGKMYGIPSSNPTADFLSVMWIRQDWLDKLGLKAPTNVAELETVAKAFATQDPDGNGEADTVGIVGPSTNGRLYQDMFSSNLSFHFDQIFASYNAFPGIWVKDSEGKAVYGSILPETKAALEKLASMYKDGLISPGMLTSDTSQLIANNKGGIFFGCWWEPFANIGNSWKNDNTVNWQPYSIPSTADGIYMAKGGNAAQVYTVISKDCKNPEAVIVMLNIFKEGLKNYISEEDKAALPDGSYPMYMTFGTDAGPSILFDALQKYYNGEKTADEIRADLAKEDQSTIAAFDQIINCKTEPYDNDNISGWDFSGDKAGNFGYVYSFAVGLKPYVAKNYEWVNTLTYERTKTMDQRWTNLSDLEYTTFSKIIMGEEPISAFDTFVEKWLAEGGKTITSEIQDTLK